ncbi:MAG: sulfur carrier protein ThiS [Acidobacteriota bacterium]
MPSITIQLNGDAFEVPAGETVSSLLERLKRDARTVAVEHNGEIVRRDQYAEARIEAGDRLEIVAFVQGG